MRSGAYFELSVASGIVAAADLPIVQYWDQGEPPGYIGDLLASFADRNPTMDHRVFDERGAAELIAAHFGERESAAFRSCAVSSMRADYFRYCAVLALGGVYADAGYRCGGSLLPLAESTDGGVLFRRGPTAYFFNSFFAFRAPGHPLLRLALDVATANIERRPTERIQMVTGPWIFTALALLHDLGGSAQAASGDGAVRGIDRLVEPFRRDIAIRVPTADGRRAIEPMLEPLFETVADHARLSDAFEGVRIASLEEMAEWIHRSQRPLLYKQSSEYWINWQAQGRSIFR